MAGLIGPVLNGIKAGYELHNLLNPDYVCPGIQKIYVPLVDDRNTFTLFRKNWADARDLCREYGNLIDVDLELYTMPQEHTPGLFPQDILKWSKQRVSRKIPFPQIMSFYSSHS